MLFASYVAAGNTIKVFVNSCYDGINVICSTNNQYNYIYIYIYIHTYIYIYIERERDTYICLFMYVFIRAGGDRRDPRGDGPLRERPPAATMI